MINGLGSRFDIPHFATQAKNSLLTLAAKVYTFIYNFFMVIFGHPDPVYPTTAKIEVEEQKELPYQTLKELSEQDKENIHFIFHTLANSWVFNPVTVNTKGDAIQHVHPYKLLEHLFNTPQLKNDLKIIKKGHLWNQIMQHFSNSFNKHNDSLLYHLPNFASAVGHRVADLKPHIQNRKWEVLVIHLFETSPAPQN